MKPKFLKTKSIRASLLAILLIVEFFGFGSIQRVQAACAYNVKSFGTDKQSYNSNEAVKFNATLEVSNDVTQCTKTLRFKYSVKVYKLTTAGENSYYDKSQTTFKPIGTEDVSLNGVYAESKNFQFSLSNLDFAQEVADPAHLTFGLDVTDKGIIYDSSVLSSKNNTQLSINVNGVSVGGSGTGYSLNMELRTISDGTYKYDFVKTIDVAFYLSYEDAKKNAWNVEVNPKVNGQTAGKPWPIKKDQLANRNIQSFNFTPSSGFHNGDNIISIVLTVEGSPNATVANGTIHIQGEGFPATSTPKNPQGTPNAPAVDTPNSPAQGTPNSPSKPSPVDCSKPDNCLYNPLPEEELTHAFLVIIQGFLSIVGIWAVIFIIVGAFQLVGAAGSEEAILKAKKTITWAVLGLVIALLSFSIIAIVQNLIKATVQH